MSDYEIRRWDIRQVIALTDLMLSFKFTNTTFFRFFLFVLQKSIRGAKHKSSIKQLPRPASRDVKVLLLIF